MNSLIWARSLIVCFAIFSAAVSGDAVLANAGLRVYWTDVEGGAATLIVTPAGEAILIDAGLPGPRDASRILKTARQEAGLDEIDILVVTHFDLDHYGGVADVADRISIGKVYDPGFPEKEHPIWHQGLPRYRETVEGKREVIGPGDTIPLRQKEGTPSFTIRCLAANQKFIDPVENEPGSNPVCESLEEREKDRSQNANSVVLLLEYGPFRFLDAADLTWNLEGKLVCPHDLVGEVDVYQTDHHGLDASNNPVLIETIRPTVAIANNGPHKGPGLKTFETLSRTPSIQAIYQLHLNLDNGPEGNTQPERIANLKEECNAEMVVLEVAPDGASYAFSIPSKGTRESFETKMGEE